jgi:ornithine carbamoyltransferase
MRHFLNLIDLTAGELTYLLDEAARLKADALRGIRPPLLSGRVLGMIFEKPSLRTRASFEAAMAHLGGNSIFLSASDGPIGQRESVADFARTLNHYVDAVVLRTYKHATIEEFASHAKVPVINGLSDLCHPCQVLGDLLTIQEHFEGGIRGKTLVFIGDGNNVARSLALGCRMLGARFILAAPEGYRFDPGFLQTFHRVGGKGELIQNGVPSHAVGQADIIYTDVWTSMGQEDEKELRSSKFSDFQVNGQLLAEAPSHTRLMHCLPAHRGEEITSEVLDGPRSIVFEHAGNRMHAQKALLKWLMLEPNHA